MFVCLFVFSSTRPKCLGQAGNENRGGGGRRGGRVAQSAPLCNCPPPNPSPKEAARHPSCIIDVGVSSFLSSHGGRAEKMQFVVSSQSLRRSSASSTGRPRVGGRGKTKDADGTRMNRCPVKPPSSALSPDRADGARGKELPVLFIQTIIGSCVDVRRN